MKEEISFNFLDNYTLFYNWLKEDKIIKSNKYKLIKVSSNTLEDLILYNIRITLDKGIYIFSDGYSFISLYINNNENKLISSLLLEDEEKLKLPISKLKTKKIEYQKNGHRKKESLLRYKESIKKEILNIKDEDMLKYIYFELFSKKENNINIIKNKINKLIYEDINMNDRKIYDLLFSKKSV